MSPLSVSRCWLKDRIIVMMQGKREELEWREAHIVSRIRRRTQRADPAILASEDQIGM